jgi:Transposase IS116/IS110/IS902 family
MASVDWPPGAAGRLDCEQSIASWSAPELQHLRARRQECDDVGYELFAGAAPGSCPAPGVRATTSAVIIAEVGDDMTRFPTPAHLSSWARFAPGVKESAGRKKGTGATGHGDRHLMARVLGEAAVSAARTNTFLGERYRRIARRRGKKKAIVAIAVPSWPSSGTYCPIPKPVTTTWVPATRTHASTQNVGSATTSANSRLSATRSPCNPLPDPPEYSTSPLQPIPAHCAPPGCFACPLTPPFSTQDSWPRPLDHRRTSEGSTSTGTRWAVTGPGSTVAQSWPHV